MAIQANMYPENLGLPITSQDYLFNNNNYNNNFANDLSYNKKLLQQQLQYQQQLQNQQYQQQQYMIYMENARKRNDNSSSLEISQPWKKQNVANNSVTTTASTISSECDEHRSGNLSSCFSDELEKQGKEIDRFISLQNERLKLAIQAQRKQQFITIIKKLEAKAIQLLSQKDEEISQATKKAIEYQEIINKLEVENQAWQRIASENEAMVYSLNNSLEQLKQQLEIGSSSNCADDAESCCNDNGNDDAEKTEEENRGNVCKECNVRNVSVLMLPCRHLCSCKECDVPLEACPVCKSSKMASIEVIIS